MPITTWIPAKLASVLFKKLVNKSIEGLTEQSFAERLNQVINRTIDAYEKEYSIPSDDASGYHFTKSQDLVTILVEFSFFKEIEEARLETTLRQNPKIQDFQKEEVNRFYQLFLAKAKEDDLLRKLDIEAHYKTHIFKIFERQEEVIKEIKKIQALLEDFLSKLSLQEQQQLLTKIGIQTQVTGNNNIVIERSQGNTITIKQYIQQLPEQKQRQLLQMVKFITTPPPDPQYFKGRTQLLKDLHEKLQEKGKLLIVNGLGGMGKSAVAARYIHSPEYLDAYDQVAWVTVNNSIKDQLTTQLGNALHLDFTQKNNDQSNFDWLIFQLVNDRRNNLLIIDNVNSLDEFGDIEYDIKGIPWSVLITSRVLPEDFEHLPVNELSEADAKALFLDYYPHVQVSDQDLDDLLNHINRHTLLIELTARLAKKNDWSIPKVLEILRQSDQSYPVGQEKVKIGLHAALSEGQRRDQIDHYLMAMFQPKTITDVEHQKILRYFSILPPEFIPKAQVLALFDLESTSVLNTLYRMGWLDKDTVDIRFKMHPLLQDLVRRQLKPNLENTQLLRKSLENIFETHNESYLKDHAYPAYAESILDFFDQQDDWIGRFALFNLGPYFKNIGDFEKALTYFKRAEKIFDYLKDKRNLAVSYQYLGSIYQEKGNAELALQFFQKMSKSFEELVQLNPHSADFKDGLANSYQFLGIIHKEKGNAELALEFFQKMSKGFEELVQLNPHSADFKKGLASSYEKLGNIYQEKGNAELALQFFQKMSKSFEELVQLNPHSADFKYGLASSYQFLGIIHKAKGNSELALLFFEKMSKSFEELVQLNPHSAIFKNGLAISYQYLGNIYQEKGNAELALEFFEKYNKLQEELVQLNPHSAVFKNGLANSYQFLGIIHKEKGNSELALQFFQKYNKLREELVQLNPHSANFKNGLAISYQYLGNIYQEKGNSELALQFFQKNNKLREELVQLNPHSADFKKGLAISYEKLGDIYQEKGNAELALEFFQKYNKLLEELVQLNPHSANFKNGLAISWYKLAGVSPKEQAIAYYQQAEKAWQELYELTGYPMYDKYLTIVREKIADMA